MFLLLFEEFDDNLIINTISWRGFSKAKYSRIDYVNHVIPVSEIEAGFLFLAGEEEKK
jgi:hypothetical protein